MTKKRELITVVEAAQLRNVTRQAIENLIKRGKIKTYSVKVVEQWVDREEVMAYQPNAGGRPKKATQTQ